MCFQGHDSTCSESPARKHLRNLFELRLIVGSYLCKNPKVRRKNLPPALLNHLLDRVQERQISADELGILADWLAHEPDVPDGKT